MIPPASEDLRAGVNPQRWSCIGLIPARAGSKRVPNKNVRLLNGHPLLAYTVCAAIDSACFARVVVSTESAQVAAIAKRYGAEVPVLRPAEFADDRSPDIEWIRHLLSVLWAAGERYDCFSILRPTSPFRLPDTIRRAWQLFREDGSADSLRAVERCNEHPAKMWIVEGSRMRPLIENPDPKGTPWHSTPYQALPPIYVQNASLEIAHCKAPLEMGTIAGTSIMPFFTEGAEGFDINSADDWTIAKQRVREDPALLPAVRTVP